MKNSHIIGEKMSQKIVDNLSRENNKTYDFNNAPSGYGTQFILRCAAVVSQLKIRLSKDSWGTAPTGTLVARLYGSHTDVFRDPTDYAEGLIAESTNSVDIDALTPTMTDAAFMFDDVALSPGVYFICIYSADYSSNDGSVQIFGTDAPANIVGSITVWNNDHGRWESYMEWD